MANRTKPLRPIHWVAGGGSLGLLLLLTLGTVGALGFSGSPQRGIDPVDWAAIRFTLYQAFLSASASVLLAIPVSRALARRKFRGRSFYVAFLGAPFLLPAIAAVLGILAIWGRSGVISDGLQVFGLEPINIFGLFGVVLAHVFFNLPLAVRLILQGWLSIPSEHFRLSAQLCFTDRDIRRKLEYPMLASVIPGAFLLIFLLCTTSFAVALALGGGPRATTIEVAIYQALRFDFDLPKAALLALVQFAICAFLAALALKYAKVQEMSLGLDRQPQRWDGTSNFARFGDTGWLMIAGLFLFAPLAALLVRGAPSLLALPTQVWPALLTSVVIALCSTALAIVMAVGLSITITRVSLRRKRASKWMEAIGFLTLAASPFVIGTGLFIIINPWVDPFALALPITAAINAAMALPFALRVILPALLRTEGYYGRLGDSLGMTRWTRFRLAIWPRLKRPVGFAAGLSAALSMGDLGVIALFAPPDIATLPLVMHRLMSDYQMDNARGAALLLIGASLFLFWIFDRGGRIDNNIR
jgi:thiamine transport system permease protein